MLYLIRYQIMNNETTLYHLFETHTESVIKANNRVTLELIRKHGLEIKNIYIDNGHIQIKKWPNTIRPYSRDRRDGASEYILLGRSGAEEFKLVNNAGDVSYIGSKQLKAIIETADITNCDYIEGEKIYRSTDTSSLMTDPAFKKYIAREYERFAAKTTLLGLNMGFQYIVEGEDVKLVHYTGKDSKVIVPNFVTAICGGAFRYRGITSLILNSGLKYIGSYAFTGNQIDYIELPETVEFVGQGAFKYTISGVTFKGVHKKLNDNVLMLDELA